MNLRIIVDKYIGIIVLITIKKEKQGVNRIEHHKNTKWRNYNPNH